jgi:hypothetical protein
VKAVLLTSLPIEGGKTSNCCDELGRKVDRRGEVMRPRRRCMFRVLETIHNCNLY